MILVFNFEQINLYLKNNCRILAHVAFSEHILVLRQLPEFSSCRVFGTYPGFETITGIHINVNFQVFISSLPIYAHF